VISSTLFYGAAASALLLALLWLIYRYSLFLPAPAGLPILLYHKVSRNHNDRLTISVDRLDRQLAYIRSEGYTGISFLELKESLEGRRPLPAKPVLLTFDDGYLSTYELAYPLLRKHQLKATVFLPTAFIGGVNGWDGGSEPLMSYDILRKIAGTEIEFGLHSSRHESFQSYSAVQVEADLSECLRTMEESGCPFTRVFAYPYGRVPKDESVQRDMRQLFKRLGIDFAARIGSRINVLPPRDVYEMKRTAVNGADSFSEFKVKLHKGRTKLF
jgi:peptidoglycan/xylan/chitin deacetylase (PgdA/CDA1 family)